MLPNENLNFSNAKSALPASSAIRYKELEPGWLWDFLSASKCRRSRSAVGFQTGYAECQQVMAVQWRGVALMSELINEPDWIGTLADGLHP